MNNSKAKDLLKKIVSEVENDGSIESIGDQLMAVRDIALQLEDPLVVKTPTNY